MSVESMTIVLHHSRARGTAKLVLLGIANHDGDGGAWPSVATLARYANVHPRKVQEAIGRLRELGELTVHVQQGGLADHDEAHRPNLYTLNLSCPADCDRTKQHRTRQQLRLVTGAEIGRGADSGTRGVTEAAPGGVPIAAPKPSTEPNMKRSGEVQRSTTDRATETEGQRRVREAAEKRARLAANAADPETVRAHAAAARAALAARSATS